MPSTDAHSVASVVSEGLCHGCLVCLAVCPHAAISACANAAGQQQPVVDTRRCDSCGKCLRACSGKVLWGSRRSRYGRTAGVWVGHASDETIRRQGASGGVVSAITAAVLSAGDVDAVLVNSADERVPWCNRSRLVRHPDELSACSKSRYTTTEIGLALRDACSDPAIRRIAIVGLPCQLASVSFAAGHGLLDVDVVLKIGLLCGKILNPIAAELSLQATGHTPKDVVGYTHRASGWDPFCLGTALRDGTRRNTVWGETHFQRLWDAVQLAPNRCLLCNDFCAEFADVACGDAWLPRFRGDSEGHSLVQAHSLRGLRLIERLSGATLTLEEASDQAIEDSQSHQLEHKKVHVHARVRAMLPSLVVHRVAWGRRAGSASDSEVAAGRRQLDLNAHSLRVARSLSAFPFHWRVFAGLRARLVRRFLPWEGKPESLPLAVLRAACRSVRFRIRHAALRLRKRLSSTSCNAWVPSHPLYRVQKAVAWTFALGLRLTRSLRSPAGYDVVFPSTQPGNLGDEAVLTTFVQEVRRQGGTPLVVSLSHEHPWNVEGAETVCFEVPYAASLVTTVRLLAFLARQPRFHLWGADVMDLNFPPPAPQFRRELLSLANTAGTRCSLFGASFWAKTPPRHARSLCTLSSRVRITSRDEVSRERLLRLGGVDRTVEVMPDLAFALEKKEPPPNDPHRHWLDDQVALGRRVIVININHYRLRPDEGFMPPDRCIETYEELLVQLVQRQCDLAFLLVPHYYSLWPGEPDDVTVLRGLASRLGDRHPGLPYHLMADRFGVRELRWHLSRCHLTVTGKMHMAIAALSQCVPPLSFAYSGKFEGLFRLFDLDSLVLDPKLMQSPDHVADVVCRTLENLPALRARIAERIDGVIEHARRHICCDESQ